ncbi:unnamed protein product [Ambrosiozyma monospora]|uniref:Unnamed protein product n=1 Tax=Ambrosiozyma monospora TaxID=43982 RepID=A0ACB5SVI4_AMBMO|nr:unnamed protein product [Ambrosiozyma monospora]
MTNCGFVISMTIYQTSQTSTEVRHNGVLERLELNQADYITKLGDKVGIHRGKKYMTPMTPGFQFDPHDKNNVLNINGYTLSQKLKQCGFGRLLLHTQIYYCLFVHDCKRPVYWKSRAGEIVATSSTESELVGMVNAGKEFVYLLNVARVLNMKVGDTHTCYVDNTASITVAHTSACKGRTKHLGIMIAKANDLETKDEIHFKYIPTKDQLADILTKPVATTVMDHIVKNTLSV